MSLYVNKTKMENVYFKGSKIDRVFANGTLVYESTIYVAKPSVSGSYTYNMSTQSAVITGYNAAAMTISGTQSATEAGTYHVYFTLNKGYAWADGSTTKLDFTWSIAKRQINIPSLSSTWFAWVEGNSHNVVVNNLDTNYVNQSGTLSQTDSSSNIDKTYTVSWSLKNATSCVWTDNTNNTKSATWKVAWSNGTSHYSNDLYNCGWNSGKLTVGPYLSTVATATFESDHIAWTILSSGPSTYNPYVRFMYETASAINAGKTIHVAGTGALSIGSFYKSGSDSYTGNAGKVTATNPSDLSYKQEADSYDYHYSIGGKGKTSGTVTRIWLT